MSIATRKKTRDLPGAPLESDAFFGLSEDLCCVLRADDGVFVGVNSAWTQILGWPTAQLEGQQIAGLLHPDDEPAMAAATRTAAGGAPDQRVSTRVRAAGGGYVGVAWKLRSDGPTLLAIGRVEEHAAIEYELIDFVFAAVGAGVCRLSADGRIVAVSDHYCELLGVSRGALIGSFPPQAGSDPTERTSMLDVAAAARNGDARRAAVEITRGDGSRVMFGLVGLSLPGPAQPGADALVVVRDLAREERAGQELEDTRRWLRDVAASTGQGVWIGDAAGDAEWVDPQLARMLGVLPASVLARSFEMLVPVALRGQVRAALDGARRERITREIETRLTSSDGAEIPAVVGFHALPGDQGRNGAIVATVTRINGSRPDDAAVSKQTELLDVLGAAVMALDKRGRIVHWNEAARRLAGFTAAEAEGQPGVPLLMPDAAPAERAAMRDALDSVGSWQGPITMRRKDGVAIPIHAHVVRPQSRHGAFAAVAVAIDMSQHKDTESKLEDARGYLSAVASTMAEGLFALTPDGRLAYMNENAERMLGWRLEEVKGRYMHSAVHYQRPDGSGYPAHECPMLRAAQAGQTISVAEDHLTRKDGTLIPVEYTTAPIRTARGSRGTVVVVRDISHRRAEQQRAETELEGVAWVSRLRDAIDNDRLLVFAQPIVDMATGVTDRYELLVRMLVDGDVVAPCEFLPHAEENGLIGEIDRWVVHQAAKLAASGTAVQLNVAAQSIADPTLVADVGRILRETGADPAKLTFEITEAALLTEEDATRAFAEAATRLGCQLALEDFGTRYGGFAHLKRLTVQYLKIDIEFVRDLLEDESSAHVVKAIVDLAHSFGQKTIAEGVEEPETLERLRSLGVDFAQGYLIGRPAPVRELIG
jgi:PAS domain S-box-containing protein